jgi:hypothetical protein
LKQQSSQSAKAARTVLSTASLAASASRSAPRSFAGLFVIVHSLTFADDVAAVKKYLAAWANTAGRSKSANRHARPSDEQ